jgi:hypothetical protein
MQIIKQSESTASLRTVYITAINSADDTPYTGAFTSAELRISKAGGAEANSAGTATHIANGVHAYQLTVAEVNTLGPVLLRIARTGVYGSAFSFQVVVTDPYSATASADALLDRADGVEAGLTLRNALRAIAAGQAAKRSGAGTATEVYRNAVADSKNRMTVSTDASGNVTAITYDFT